MNAKKGPLILIVFLIVVLVFVLGVRYGQRVEMTNKTVSLALSLTPAGPTVTKSPLQFATYTSKDCGVEFLYPSSVSLIKRSTEEAKLSQDSALAVAFSCAKNPSFAPFFEDKSVVTSQVTFQKQVYKARVRKTDSQKYLFFTLRNPLTGKTVSLAVEEKLYPLLQSSLIFK